MSMINRYVRKLLKKTRRAKRLSLRQVGKFTGICFTTVNSMEAGKHGINLDNLLKLAELYQVPASYFLREAERLASLASARKPIAREPRQEIAVKVADEGPREEVALPV
jgi:transcriptional regulator with XRE-family HTH domain